MSRDSKRSAVSPLSDDGEEKRLCISGDGSFLVSDPEATIIDTEFLSSTVLDLPQSSMTTEAGGRPLREELKAALCDPEVLEMISKAVAVKVTDQLRKEISGLREKIVAKDREILLLKDQVDSLEQYSRRNCLRIGPVPEITSENTDEIVKTVAKSIGVTLPDDAIDRSHRVGRVTPGAAQKRSILVKFTSFKYKEALLKARRRLNQVDAAKLLPDPEWPPLPATATAAGSSNSSASPVHRIFINEDLTKIRAEVAAKARQLKRNGKVDDTWIRDGIIFVKKSDTVNRISTLREIQMFS